MKESPDFSLTFSQFDVSKRLGVLESRALHFKDENMRLCKSKLTNFQDFVLFVKKSFEVVFRSFPYFSSITSSKFPVETNNKNKYECKENIDLAVGKQRFFLLAFKMFDQI